MTHFTVMMKSTQWENLIALSWSHPVISLTNLSTNWKTVVTYWSVLCNNAYSLPGSALYSMRILRFLWTLVTACSIKLRVLVSIQSTFFHSARVASFLSNRDLKWYSYLTRSSWKIHGISIATSFCVTSTIGTWSKNWAILSNGFWKISDVSAVIALGGKRRVCCSSGVWYVARDPSFCVCGNVLFRLYRSYLIISLSSIFLTHSQSWAIWSRFGNTIVICILSALFMKYAICFSFRFLKIHWTNPLTLPDSILSWKPTPPFR